MTTTTSSPSTAIAVAEPVFTHQEQLALAGFLAGYTGLTPRGIRAGLRQYANWCQQHHLHLFQVRRADIECFARDLTSARANDDIPELLTMARRLPLGERDRRGGPDRSHCYQVREPEPDRLAQGPQGRFLPQGRQPARPGPPSMRARYPAITE
jgi:hypothetical protein